MYFILIAIILPESAIIDFRISFTRHGIIHLIYNEQAFTVRVFCNFYSYLL